MGKIWQPSQCFGDDEFEMFATKWRDLGAKLIGGCCRTTPSTIKAISRDLKRRWICWEEYWRVYLFLFLTILRVFGVYCCILALHVSFIISKICIRKLGLGAFSCSALSNVFFFKIAQFEFSIHTTTDENAKMKSNTKGLCFRLWKLYFVTPPLLMKMRMIFIFAEYQTFKNRGNTC